MRFQIESKTNGRKNNPLTLRTPFHTQSFQRRLKLLHFFTKISFISFHFPSFFLSSLSTKSILVMGICFVYRLSQMDILRCHRNRGTTHTNVQCVMYEYITIDAKYLRTQITLVDIFVQIGKGFLACVALFTLLVEWNFTIIGHWE